MSPDFPHSCLNTMINYLSGILLAIVKITKRHQFRVIIGHKNNHGLAVLVILNYSMMISALDSNFLPCSSSMCNNHIFQ